MDISDDLLSNGQRPLFHRENGGTLRILPLLFNPAKEPLRKGYTVANTNIKGVNDTV